MTQCTWMILKHPDDLMVVWAVCYLRVPNFKKHEMYSVLSDIDHISLTPRSMCSHTRVDFDKKTPVEVLLWRESEDVIQTTTRTITSTTYSLVLVAIHQNDAFFCWNWKRASGKSHVLSKRFAVRNQGEIPLKPTEKLKVSWRDPETTTWSESMHNKWFNHIQSFFGFGRIEVQQKTD